MGGARKTSKIIAADKESKKFPKVVHVRGTSVEKSTAGTLLGLPNSNFSVFPYFQAIKIPNRFLS